MLRTTSLSLLLLWVPGLAVAQMASEPVESSVPTDAVPVAIPPDPLEAAELESAEPVEPAPAEVTARAPSADVLARLDDTDDAIEQRLQAILSSVDRFDGVDVDVQHGVVRLSGQLPSFEDAEAIVEIASSLEGVTYVNDRTEQSRSVSSRIAPIQQRAEEWAANIVNAAPLILIALLALLLTWSLGRFISNRDALFQKVVHKPILRDLARRIVRVIFSAIGLIFALEILDATAIVGTILGAAGVLGLAVGFAFKDIAENYLASFLLVSRRPFGIGDSVVIDENEGKVIRLTMRETVLMTFDGNHLSLPNALVFKAAVLNYTRNPYRRFDFVVGAGVDTDLHSARKLGIDTLSTTPGVLDGEHKPFSQIDELGDSNVSLRFFGWVDQRDADFFQVRSEAIRRVKVALEDAGVDMPEPIYRVMIRQSDQVAKPKTSESIDQSVDVSPDHTLDRRIAYESKNDENLIDERSDVVAPNES